MRKPVSRGRRAARPAAGAARNAGDAPAAPRGSRRAAAKGESAWEMVYRIVRAVPKGRVTTYGRISEALGRRLSAAAVGWAMAVCPGDVPWQRVVNAAGGFSTDRRAGGAPGLQAALLRKEGVRVMKNGALDLDRYVWVPPRRGMS